jgi:hypothetical protein
VVDAVRCAVDVQRGMAERNAGVPPEERIDCDSLASAIDSKTSAASGQSLSGNYPGD